MKYHIVNFWEIGNFLQKKILILNIKTINSDWILSCPSFILDNKNSPGFTFGDEKFKFWKILCQINLKNILISVE